MLMSASACFVLAPVFSTGCCAEECDGARRCGAAAGRGNSALDGYVQKQAACKALVGDVCSGAAELRRTVQQSLAPTLGVLCAPSRAGSSKYAAELMPPAHAVML